MAMAGGAGRSSAEAAPANPPLRPPISAAELATAAGVLGLDMYAMRAPLAQAGLIYLD